MSASSPTSTAPLGSAIRALPIGALRVRQVLESSVPRQSFGSDAKSLLAFLYHRIAEIGCFHLPFMS